MNLTRLSLDNPVAVIAATLLIFLMGGIGAGSLIEVIGDLRPGDRVVIRGAERLQNGTTVNIGEIASTTGSETQALQ